MARLKAATRLPRRPPLLPATMVKRTICRRLRQRAEQVLASRRPLKEQLQIKHFLAAILFLVFGFSKP
jgi:hypothetical protein